VHESVTECLVNDFGIGELKMALNAMKRHKSAGQSLCKIDVFKGECNDNVLKCVQHVFNHCNMYGLPDSWKTALVMPLFKKGDKADCANYRGISLIPPLAKWYTKCVLRRLDREAELKGLRADE
jgi:hypothetical protein